MTHPETNEESLDLDEKPGPEPEVFKVALPFEEAVKAALKTPPPPPRPK